MPIAKFVSVISNFMTSLCIQYQTEHVFTRCCVLRKSCKMLIMRWHIFPQFEILFNGYWMKHHKYFHTNIAKIWRPWFCKDAIDILRIEFCLGECLNQYANCRIIVYKLMSIQSIQCKMGQKCWLYTLDIKYKKCI